MGAVVTRLVQAVPRVILLIKMTYFFLQRHAACQDLATVKIAPKSINYECHQL